MPGFDRGFDIKTGYRTKSILCVPVRGGEPNNVAAVLQAINKKLPNGDIAEFDERDQQTLTCVADNAGIALHKAQLVEIAERARRKSESLISVMKAVSGAGDTDKLIHNLVQVAYDILEADRITLFLVDEMRDELLCTISKDAAGFRVPIGKGIAGTVAKTGETINIPEVRDPSAGHPANLREAN